MDFALTLQQQDFRDEVRAVVDAYVTPELHERVHRTGTYADKDLYRALAARGWLAGAVPGLGERDPIELYLLFHELETQGAPFDGLVMNMMISGVINHLGSQFLKDSVMAPLLAGDGQICMGFSEPGSGSDVANCTTRAERKDDGWLINGHKMWTTLAHVADWVILLTRTDPAAAKHRGLTMFLVPMNLPGVDVHPVLTMGAERTNATYYTDVELGDEWRIGEVGGGWTVMVTALAFERGVMGNTNPGVHLLSQTAAGLSGAARDPGRVPGRDEIAEELARIAIENQVSTLLTQRAAWIAAQGGLPGLEGSKAKLFSSEAYQRGTARLLELLGADGLYPSQVPGAAADGWLNHHVRHSPVTTIYGGTSEIIRNAIAERELGLPKTRKA
jgi:alkylation response protein AidB-like acyl-CoA dehydrogenase